MLWIIITLIGLAVIILLIRYFSESDEDFGELKEGLIRIQKNAFDHITAEDSGDGIKPARLDLLDRISFQTSNRFSVVYTIAVDDKDNYLHTISGKPLKKQSQKTVIENMLLLMTVFSSQFKEANFGEDVKFAIDESELGTMYVEFLLNAEQQEVFEAVIFGKSRPRKTQKPEKSEKLKAQCPKCNAAYKVDRAKIPDKGAYTRCTRCKERFIIRKQ